MTGVADADVGEAVVAYVTVARGATVTEQELLLYCSHHLEDFMIPKTVHIVDELPHGTSGKLLRRHFAAPASN